MIDQIGGRKAAIALLIVALGVGAVLIKGDIPANFMHLLEVIFGTFVIGNVSTTVSAHVSGVAEGAESTKPVESTPAVDLTPVVSALSDIKQQNETVIQALSTSQQGIGFLCSYVSQQMTAATVTQAQANRGAIPNG